MSNWYVQADTCAGDSPARRRFAAAVCAAALATLLSAAGVPARADTVLHGARGYTWTESGLRRFQSLRIGEDGRVLGIANGNPWQGESGIVLRDLAGAVVLPGLIDAHAHVLSLGRLRANVDVTGAKSAAEVVAAVAAFAAQHPDRAWITGRGWNQELWADTGYPTAEQLDAVVADRPVWLRRIDGHAGWANTLALELGGIDGASEAPRGGLIVRDEDGAATGILVDLAMERIEQVIPAPDRASDLEALRLALQEMGRLGLTGVHDAGVTVREIGLYRELAAGGELNLRAALMLGGIPAMREFGKPEPAGAQQRLSVRAVKLYADGALGSRGAALLEPYCDAPGERGLLFHTDAEMEAMIREAAGAGYQVAVHAIGDAANRQVLDAFERVHYKGSAALRHRIEHAQIVAPGDISRFAQLGIIASVQPVHATSDMWMAEKRLDPPRLAGAYAWRKLLRNGARLAAGSDFPVELANPFHGLHAAITRTDLSGRPAGGWRSGEALSPGEALRAFTIDAAWAGHMENYTGSLEPGKWADLIVLDRDPLAPDTKNPSRAVVRETWVSGQAIYRAPIE